MPHADRSPPDHRRPRRRRGSIKGGLVVALLGGGVLGGTAIAFRPRPLGASVTVESIVGAERAMAVQRIADIVRRSAGVIAVHHRDGAPFNDVVLHAFDGSRRGTVETGEILVLTHSRTLRALMAFSLDPSRAPEDEAARPVDRATLSDPGFARSWRDRPDVRRDVVPAGMDLLDLELLPAERPRNVGSGPWTLRLTWADGSADGSDTVEVHVDPAAEGP